MNPDLVAAISKFPSPKDLTNLRSLIWLVNWFNDQKTGPKTCYGPLATPIKEEQQICMGRGALEGAE